MEGTCVVAKNGNSATVVLPAEWRRACGIEIGDELEFHANANGEISFSKKAGRSKTQAADELLVLIGSRPNTPWLRGDSPDDDKELIRGLVGNRHA